MEMGEIRSLILTDSHYYVLHKGDNQQGPTV